MFEDAERDAVVTVQDVADAMLFVILEISRAFGGVDVSEKLETMANELIESANRLPACNTRTLLLATAQNLIETESGMS